MNKNYLKEFSSICDSNSILVINRHGIYRLYTPFKVTCIISVESHHVGDEVTVVGIKMSNNYKLVYLIGNKSFFHHYFIIISKPTTIQSNYN